MRRDACLKIIFDYRDSPKKEGQNIFHILNESPCIFLHIGVIPLILNKLGVADPIANSTDFERFTSEE